MEKQIKLTYADQTSDKVYKINMVKSEVKANHFMVVAQYGRRGKYLTTTVKAHACPIDDALEVYHKLILSKKRKGYVEEVGYGES